MTSEHSATLFFSPRRVWTIAQNTIVQIARQKFFYILLVFALVVLGCAQFFVQFSSAEQIKFIKDFSLGAMTLFGAAIAIVSTAELLPLELDNRTIYPILAKPVFRSEFLLGKLTGIISLLLLTLGLMSLIFWGILLYNEGQLVQTAMSASNTPSAEVSPQEVIRQIQNQTRDPNLIKAILMIFMKVTVVASISLLISTFATSVIFNVISSVMIYISGHLEGIARQATLGDQSLGARLLSWIITFLVPDLGSFDVVDSIILGKEVPWNFVLKTCGNGIFYVAIFLTVSLIIFQEKEI